MKFREIQSCTYSSQRPRLVTRCLSLNKFFFCCTSTLCFLLGIAQFSRLDVISFAIHAVRGYPSVTDTTLFPSPFHLTVSNHGTSGILPSSLLISVSGTPTSTGELAWTLNRLDKKPLHSVLREIYSSAPGLSMCLIKVGDYGRLCKRDSRPKSLT